MQDDIVIVGAARTPVGSFNGALASLSGHALAFDARAHKGRFDRDLAQRMARQRSQRAVERADRRTRRADDDNVVLH